MKQKYCLPIIKSSSRAVLEMISKNKSYDFFEIWLDYIGDLNFNFIENLKKNYGEKLILLFRRQNLKKPKMNFDRRIKIIELIYGSDCFVDLDIFSQREEIEYVKENAKGLKLILSYHNYKETPPDQKLKEIVSVMTKQKAGIYKIATFCKTDEDMLRLIDLNTSLKEENLKCIILGMGEKGSLTRIAAAYLGDELIFAPVSRREKSAKGQFTKQELEKILRNLKVCLFLADPAEHSMSPQMHEVGYIALHLENDFLYLRKRVKAKDLEEIVRQLKNDPNFRGASISLPHKTEIMKYLDRIDKEAEIIGAVNTIVNNHGKLTGFNTDLIGAMTALEKKLDLKGKTVALIGAGGAARAIVYGLSKKGAYVTIFNRSLYKAKELAQEFGCKFGVSQQEMPDMDIIINATPVGMNEDKSPINKKFLNKNQIVFDVVYSPKETRLIKDAKAKGAKVVYGCEMLLYQGIAQFELFTNKKAPVGAMRKVLL